MPVRSIPTTRQVTQRTFLLVTFYMIGINLTSMWKIWFSSYTIHRWLLYAIPKKFILVTRQWWFNFLFCHSGFMYETRSGSEQQAMYDNQQPNDVGFANGFSNNIHPTNILPARIVTQQDLQRDSKQTVWTSPNLPFVERSYIMPTVSLSEYIQSNRQTGSSVSLNSAQILSSPTSIQTNNLQAQFANVSFQSNIF